MKWWSLLLTCALAASACARSPAPAPDAEPSAPPVETTESSATVTATATAATGAACASSDACGPGQRCTTEDGACDRPPGCAEGDICPTVCYGVCASGAAGAEGPDACRTDADCATVAHYCDGCHCLARNRDAPKPVCEGKPVSCVADPCDSATAQCVEGACRLAAPE